MRTLVSAVLIFTASTAHAQFCNYDGKPMTPDRITEAAKLVDAIKSANHAMETLNKKLSEKYDSTIQIFVSDGAHPGCGSGCFLYGAATKDFGKFVGPLIQQRIDDAKCSLRRLGVTP